MNDRPYNFDQKEFRLMGCQDMLTREHILICPFLNKSNCEHHYHQLLDGSVEEEKKSFEYIYEKSEWIEVILQQKKKTKSSGIQYTVVCSLIYKKLKVYAKIFLKRFKVKIQ